jgi:hypothetical protein
MSERSLQNVISRRTVHAQIATARSCSYRVLRRTLFVKGRISSDENILNYSYFRSRKNIAEPIEF